MNTTRTLSLTLCLALTACDGSSTTPGSDAGPSAMGTDGGSMTGTDGGSMTGSDGGGGGACPSTSPEVAIRFGGCTPLAACGGDPTGVWVYEDLCVDDVAPDVASVCADARVEDLSGTARGCVALDGVEAARDVTGHISATIVVPASCTFGMGCAPIEAALGVTCTLDAGDCRCPWETDFGETSTDTYTVTGSTLTLGDGSTYDFCVDGGSLSYRETGSSADEPGVARLGR
ncbi:MAG: hypothetical protein H6719_18325 [Sandaracinaceae bacterium]|nr:hypothetical protein [Sandaracinaceae bacterium]